MRDNGPVTQRENALKDDTIIVSRTDEKGRITFTNKDFEVYAGMVRDELQGQPHNIIRHPDMPTEAFEDLWRDLKAGKPWSGYVKNRAKNGDHYWVLANAMPEVTNGQITGYISIRSKPDANVVRQVEAIYKKFKDKTQGALRIEHGRVIDGARKAAIKRWLERLGSKVSCMGALLCGMIVLVGCLGIYVAQAEKEDLRTVYEDRVIPAGQLAEIKGLLYDTVVNLQTIESNTTTNTSKMIIETEQNITAINKLWDAYMATYLTPEEKILADEFSKQQKEYAEKGVAQALAYAKNGNMPALTAHIEPLHALFEKANDTNKKLIQLQLDVAKEVYDESQRSAFISLIINIAVILLGMFAAYMSARALKRALTSRLSYVDSRLGSIMGGNYLTQIDVQSDELQNILTTVKALQAKLLFSDLEKKELAIQQKEMQAKLADDFEKSVKSIVNIVASASTQLSQTAASMVHSAQDSTKKASQASDAANLTSNNVQAVAAASEELSSTVKEISGQLQKMSSLVTLSQEKAKNADTVASAVSDATKKVTVAVDMISNISDQINLLALNATIESARAGDAGKGFAVVAGEVKSLAGQTNRNVTEIQAIVDDMRNASLAITTALGEIGSSVGSIVEATSSVASAVEEQSATTNDIARNMQTAASNTTAISNNLQEVQASSSQVGTASEQMLAASKELSKQAEELNTQVDNFLGRVRAA